MSGKHSYRKYCIINTSDTNQRREAADQSAFEQNPVVEEDLVVVEPLVASCLDVEPFHQSTAHHPNITYTQQQRTRATISHTNISHKNNKRAMAWCSTYRVTTLQTLKFPDNSLTMCGTHAHVKWYS